MKHLLILITIFTCFSSQAQDSLYTSSKKGKFFVSWGGNRESYSRSNINFRGENYNFTIEDVAAHDKPKGWHLDYINPRRLTIPQTNFKVGYFINDKYAITIGVDHMKYVMFFDQNRAVNGYINLPATDSGAQFNGVYNGETNTITKDWLEFEHTDGLNFIYLGINRYEDLSKYLGITNTDKLQVNVFGGVNAGVLFPKSNTTLMLKKRYDEFHVSGYGLAAEAGINLTFLKYFFIEGTLKGGYINMGDIRTTLNPNDRASQSFYFLQRIVSVGGIFKL